MLAGTGIIAIPSWYDIMLSFSAQLRAFELAVGSPGRIAALMERSSGN